ncbi:hypothetical protein IT415_02825 [bacterium]|nr:hypothetical protein [bacterium]
MGIRDFLRRGERGPEKNAPKKKTQEQLRAVVERRRAITDKVSVLPFGETRFPLPPDIDLFEDAVEMVFKKAEKVKEGRNPTGHYSTADREIIAEISFVTKRLEQRDDGSVSEVTSARRLYIISPTEITEYVTDPNGETLIDVDTSEFVDLEKILTQVEIQAELDKSKPEET